MLRLFIPCLLGLLAFSNCGNAGERNQAQQTRPQDEAIYYSYCKGCHGKDGTLMLGGASNLKYSTLTEEKIIGIIIEGRGTMASFSQLLTEKEIELVAAYVKGLRKN